MGRAKQIKSRNVCTPGKERDFSFTPHSSNGLLYTITYFYLWCPWYIRLNGHLLDTWYWKKRRISRHFFFERLLILQKAVVTRFLILPLNKCLLTWKCWFKRNTTWKQTKRTKTNRIITTTRFSARNCRLTEASHLSCLGNLAAWKGP